VSSSLLVGAFLGLEVNAWPLAMTLALSGLGLRLDGRRPLVAGMLIGFAFVARLDVGGYALLAALLLPDRRRLLIGFGLIVLPCALLLLALVPTAALAEQLIWYPIVGPRLYRGTPGLEALMPMSIALPMTLVLVVLPRAMVAVTAVRAFATGRRDLLSITLFAALCQLQSFGRADPAHFALAATPAIALVAANLPASPRRALAGVALVAPALFAVVAIGMLSVATNSTTKDTSLQRSITVAREATDPAAAVFVALTSNRYTVGNAPLAYYLADRAPGSRWTMFNPGVTNTDATQTQMVADLEASRTDLLILDSWGAESFEGTNDSRIPGSTILDRYVSERFRTWCDFGAFRVAVRVDWALDRPCPIAEDT
jgi:hypothetical protein